MINFVIKAIKIEQFSSFMNLNQSELVKRYARWINVDESPGYPCRVSLQDAKIGEKVLAVSFFYHDVDSPYRASGPIFVRENAVVAELEVNEIPQVLRNRMLSIRAYNNEKMMVDAEVLVREELESEINHQFLNSEVEYLHIHNAKPGCYSCSVHRV